MTRMSQYRNLEFFPWCTEIQLDAQELKCGHKC